MQITLSRNELKALLTRTFEALYGHDRDYHDMAHTALWLELCGHGCVSAVVESLSITEPNNTPAPSVKPQQPNHLIMDGSGHNLFCLSRSICDLTMALAAQHGTARLDIVNTDNNHVLMGVLTCAARQGFAAMAIYQGRIARIAPEAQYPIIYGSQETERLSFICARRCEDLEPFAIDIGEIVMDAAAQDRANKACLESGIVIGHADYEVLTQTANRVLVEATEASRKGAGE